MSILLLTQKQRDTYSTRKGKRKQEVEQTFLRANVCKGRESEDSWKKLKLFLFHPKNPFGNLFQNIALKDPEALWFSKILKKFEIPIISAFYDIFTADYSQN